MSLRDWKSKVLVQFLIVKSDWSPPSTPIISLNPSNQNSKIAILLRMFERSSNYVFEGEFLPAFKERAISYTIFQSLTIKFSGKGGHKDFREGSFKVKLKVPAPFLRVKSNRIVTNPPALPARPFLPKASVKNFYRCY